MYYEVDLFEPTTLIETNTYNYITLFSCQWERYMLCDGSPDPTIPGEINTYMNLWKEEKEHLEIQNVLEDSKQPLQVGSSKCQMQYMYCCISFIVSYPLNQHILTRNVRSCYGMLVLKPSTSIASALFPVVVNS